jgi:protein-disulfide isomerase
VRGPEDAPLVVVYADFECPYCAVLEAGLAQAERRVCFRHFPVRSKHPRAWAAAQAVEAAALQDAFWTMHDALFADQGRLEDPHLWARAETLGLDVRQFARDARSDAVKARVQRDFTSGIRAGVAATPTLFLADGTMRLGRDALGAL